MVMVVGADTAQGERHGVAYHDAGDGGDAWWGQKLGKESEHVSVSHGAT